jgi:7-carboxy-7-deazaguanine synthase
VVEQLVEEVCAFGGHHVVLTGGEPLLMKESIALTRSLKARGMHITVETAGTVWLPVACDLMSISPKLANSTPDDPFWGPQHDRTRLPMDTLARLIASYDYQLKFVVAEPVDMGEILRLVSELSAPKENVILMPEGRSADAIRAKAQWLAPLCLQHGFRYSPRVHVDIWGDKRGV